MMYDLLETYSDAYRKEKTADQSELLEQAIDCLSDAFDEPRLSEKLAGLRKAVAMTRELRDPLVEMVFDFYLANELIGTAQKIEEGIAVVRPAALLSRSAEYDEAPQRIGLNNMLASAYTLVDPAGYGDEIRTIVKLILSHPLADAEDRCIVLGARYEVELAEGDLDAARKSRDEVWAEAKEFGDPTYYLHAATYDADLAYISQDWAEMVNLAERCHQLIAEAVTAAEQEEDDFDEEVMKELSFGNPFDEDEFDEDFDDEFDDDEEDADAVIVEACRACGLAKLGRSSEVSDVRTGNPDSDAPKAYPYFLFWCEYHLANGDAQTAFEMAREGVNEMSGKGQYYRETEMIILLIRSLHAAGLTGETNELAQAARDAARHLKESGPMLARIEAARA